MHPFNRLLASLFCAAALWSGPLTGLALAQTFNATPSTLGTIPDSGGECVGVDGPPKLVAIPTSGLIGGITNISASITINHTWLGEVTAVLIAPDGTEHVLFGRTLGSAADPGWGTEGDLSGTYSFNDAAGGNWWTAAQNTGSGVLLPGAYRTSRIGGAGAVNPGAVTAMTPVFSNREANGTWYVRFTDSCRLDIGVVSALSLTLATNGLILPPVSATPDSYTAGRNTPLNVMAPGVLGNDINSPGSGALTATLVAPPSNGTVTLNTDGSFRYTAATGFLGADSFTYFASNLGGSTAPATVSITVVPIQPPTNLRVDRIVGNTVTIRWDPGAGPRATGYQLEGGVSPGQVLVSLPTPGPAITLSAPSGAFFIRVRAVDGGTVSGVSNEVPLYVEVPVAPSAPTGLTGLVNNDSLALSWKLTYGGAAPTNVILDVTGDVISSIPVGPVDTFSFAGVPPGTYTFAVRSRNATGTSVASNPVTLTFPSTCSGVPAVPRNYAFYNVGNAAYVLWDAPATGPAATSYVLNVSSAFFAGPLPVGASRSLVTNVPAGTYTVSVSAVNACGTSPATAPQVITVP